MDIRLKASVECLDGKRGGHVTGLILHPETDELTHLVVRTRGVERLVPASLIRDAASKVVRLDCTLTQLVEQPLLIETEYIRSIVEHYEYFPWGEVQPKHVPETYVVSHEHIPDGEEEIRRGMAVFAKDGRIGHIDEVVVDPVNDHITHIILREGHLWGAKEVVVGVEQVKSIEDDRIYLKASKAEISQFPAPPVGDVRPASSQEMNNLNIPLHASVHCTDGDFGHITCLIINPVDDTITHFVVNDRRFWGQEHIVPISFIVNTTAERVTVNCDCQTLAQQPKFIEYEYERLDEPIPYREEHIYWPILLPEEGEWVNPYWVPLEHEQIPVGELAARRGMAVYAAVPDDEGGNTNHVLIGHVEAFVAHPTTGHITHLSLRKGHLWGEREITVPVSAIHKIDSEGVYLKLTPEQVEQLRAVRVQHLFKFAR